MVHHHPGRQKTGSSHKASEADTNTGPQTSAEPGSASCAYAHSRAYAYAYAYSAAAAAAFVKRWRDRRS